MKVIVCIISIALCNCSDRKSSESDQEIMNDVILIHGRVDDGYYKRFPFSVKDQHRTYGLDVVNLPDEIIGKICDVKGNEKTVDGIMVLTNVSINGVRYQTPVEWSKSDDNTPPFSNLGQ